MNESARARAALVWRTASATLRIRLDVTNDSGTEVPTPGGRLKRAQETSLDASKVLHRSPGGRPVVERRRTLASSALRINGPRLRTLASRALSLIGRRRGIEATPRASSSSNDPPKLAARPARYTRASHPSQNLKISKISKITCENGQHEKVDATKVQNERSKTPIAPRLRRSRSTRRSTYGCRSERLIAELRRINPPRGPPGLRV